VGVNSSAKKLFSLTYKCGGDPKQKPLISSKTHRFGYGQNSVFWIIFERKEKKKKTDMALSKTMRFTQINGNYQKINGKDFILIFIDS
jgi:hypothetical protein